MQTHFNVFLLFLENQTTIRKKKHLWVFNLLLPQVIIAYELQNMFSTYLILKSGAGPL